MVWGEVSLGQANVIGSEKQVLTLEPIHESKQLLDPAEVLKAETSGQIKVKNFSTKYYWFRLELTNEADHSSWNILTRRLIDHVVLFEMNGLEVVSAVEAGNQIPVLDRSIKTRRQGVNLTLGPYRTKVFVLALKFGNPAGYTNFTIVSDNALRDHVEVEKALSGFYFGIVVVLIMFNVFFFKTLKDKTYLVYEVFLLTASCSVILITTPMENMVNETFGPVPHLVRGMQPMTILAAMFFVYFFLNVKTFPNYFRKAFKGLFVFLTFAMVVYPFIPVDLFATLFYAFELGVLLIFASTIYRIFHGDRSAIIYLIGLICVTIGIVIKESYSLGLHSSDIIGTWAAVVGLCFEMAFMSLAIGFRIRSRILSLVREL